MASKTEATQVQPKVYDKYKFSYTSKHDSWLKRTVIGTVEILSGRRHVHRIYDEVHKNGPNAWNVWKRAIDQLNITMEYDEDQLQKTPKSGPVIFVANHPFGILDGLIFLHLATKVRKDYFLLVNEVVAHEPVVRGHFLPVDFRPTEDAKETNLKTRQETTERLSKGEALVIFPGGGVATAKNVFGKPKEFPWRPFICTRIHQTKATVVPIHFHGKNSWLFHLVSVISMNVRLGLILHETMNKRGRTIKIDIGDPITYDQMESYKNRQNLIDFLYKKTMELKNLK